MEEKANILFAEYVKLYYNGGVFSTYFWDAEDGGISCVFLMKKNVENNSGIKMGSWDS